MEPDPAKFVVELQLVGPPDGVEVSTQLQPVAAMGAGAVEGTVNVAVKVMEFVAGVVMYGSTEVGAPTTVIAGTNLFTTVCGLTADVIAA